MRRRAVFHRRLPESRKGTVADCNESCSTMMTIIVHSYCAIRVQYHETTSKQNSKPTSRCRLEKVTAKRSKGQDPTFV